MAQRCPACGQFQQRNDVPHLSIAGQVVAWAVDLTRGSMAPGEAPDQVAARFEALHAALRRALPGLEDGARP